MNPERFEILMVKVVDGVATPEEREELMSHVVQNDELQRELEEQRAIKAVTDGWVERLRLDLVQDTSLKSGGSKLEQGLGLMLLSVGFAVLLGFGLMEFAVDPEAPLWVKAGMFSMVAGTLVLIFHAVRVRLRTKKSDRYDDVVR